MGDSDSYYSKQIELLTEISTKLDQIFRAIQNGDGKLVGEDFQLQLADSPPPVKRKKVAKKEKEEDLKSTTPLSIVSPPSEANRLASLLAALISTNLGTRGYALRKPNTAAWAEDIRKLHEIDGASWELIEEVIKWCQHDSFWKSNILSGGKLRTQFPQLVMKMNERSETTTTNVRFD